MVKIFSVYDSKGEAWGRPFFVQATGAAIRSFSDEVNSDNRESALVNHPEDFTLFEFGTFDEASGALAVYEAKKSLGCGIDFVRPKMKAV